MNNITLIGMPGAGKSTVGVLLAKTLGYAFLDTDLLIQQQEGVLLQPLVDRLGVAPFLDLESRVISSVSCTETVIAPGGSAVCRPEGMEHLRSLGRVVYLHLPLPQLKQRLSNIRTRGIAMAPGETLDTLYEVRLPLYKVYADLTISVENQSLEETVALVLDALQ